MEKKIMKDGKSQLHKRLVNKEVLSLVLSGPRNSLESPSRIDIKPVMLAGKYHLQFASRIGDKHFHRNYLLEEGIGVLMGYLLKQYRFINIETVDSHMQGMISKKGNVNLKEKMKESVISIDLNHDRKKTYFIPDGKPCEFLIKLGIMNEQGKVYKNKYDKFKQINKFLEIMDHTVKSAFFEEPIHILDFGSGKAYLTFAAYYYFNEIKKQEAHIVGLDLKKDVVELCNQLAKKLGYDHLRFIHQNIEDYKNINKLDMVISLHACDTATDAAIVNSVLWGAKYILAVPCCQHELYHKINNESLSGMLSHGLMRERTAALVTDALRALFLKKHGYEVTLTEFISMTHTPKNMMIRGSKKVDTDKESETEFFEFLEFWNLEHVYIEEFYKKQVKDGFYDL